MNYSSLQDLITLLIQVSASASFLFFAAAFLFSFLPQKLSLSVNIALQSVPTAVSTGDPSETISPVLKEAPQSILTHSPTPIAPPSISAAEAEALLDNALTEMRTLEALASNCRTYTDSLPKLYHPTSAAKSMSSAPSLTVSLGTSPQKTSIPKTQHLRSLCSQHGIKWRNANGKNRHLSNDQMSEALRKAGVALS